MIPSRVIYLTTAQSAPGTLNVVFDNTATTGFTGIDRATAGTSANVMVPLSVFVVRPLMVILVFCGQFYQDPAFQVTEDKASVTATHSLIPGWSG